MKKILFIATVTSHINTFHIPYLKWFKEHGYEVHVASNGNEKIKFCDKHYNLPFERFPLKINNIKTHKELKKIINENKYEIVHCHTPVGGVLTRLAARNERLNGTRVIYTAHGFHFYKGAPLLNWIIYYPIEKWMSKYTDTLITINLEDYELAKKNFRKIKNIEYVRGVGFKTDRLNINMTETEEIKFRNELKINSDDVVLSYIAELNANKNQILLINTVKELKKDIPNVKLLLIGSGPLKEYYDKYIRKEGLQENIILLGQRNDIAKLLSITNIYVASSIREGLPVNIMEAMYMGLPIIATDNRGHRELVKNNENGFIIKNIDEMEHKIKQIVADNKVRENFNKNSKEKSNIYEIKKIIKDMEKIYSKIL